MKREIIGKMVEIFVSDIAATAVFYIMYTLFRRNVVVQQYWWISAVALMVFVIYQNIWTIRSKEVNAQKV